MNIKWHHSEHLPLHLQVKVDWNIDLSSLTIRSNYLVHPECNIHTRSLNSFKHNFDYDKAYSFLLQEANTINHSCDQLSTTDLILEKIYSFINPILEKSKTKKVEAGENVDIAGKKCNELFKIYTESLQNTSREDSTNLYKDYQSQRNKLFMQTTRDTYNKYKVVIESHDDRNL